jgi:hypothetical protein
MPKALKTIEPKKAVAKNWPAYILLGAVASGAISILVAEFRKRKPSISIIEQQVQLVVSQVNAAFGTKVKEDTVSRCVYAVMAVLAEAK